MKKIPPYFQIKKIILLQRSRIYQQASEDSRAQASGSSGTHAVEEQMPSGEKAVGGKGLGWGIRAYPCTLQPGHAPWPHPAPLGLCEKPQHESIPRPQIHGSFERYGWPKRTGCSPGPFMVMVNQEHGRA